MRPAQAFAGKRRRQQHDQQRPQIVHEIGLGRRGELQGGEIERVVAEQAADAQQPPRASARTMPIEAPTANVMATIWNGGMGPAVTDNAAKAPHSAMAQKPAAIARRRSTSIIVMTAA